MTAMKATVYFPKGQPYDDARNWLMERGVLIRGDRLDFNEDGQYWIYSVKL